MSDREQIAITAAADAILTARDFDGNEREAAVEAIANQGVNATKELLSRSLAEANGRLRWGRDGGRQGRKNPAELS